MSLRIFLLGSAAVLLAASIAISAANAETKFLAPAQYQPAVLLPPPPAANSTAAKAELAELQRIEKARTPEQLTRARSDDKTEDASIFAEVLGSAFDLKKLPATAKMFADVRAEEKQAAADAKTFFKRDRPWIVDPAIQSCSKEDAPQSSYPSGHATMGYSMGVVLAQIAPEKAQQILARAAEYAENRLVCGMHFRRDIQAGQTLGTVVAVDLMQNQAFKAEIEAATAELRAAGVVKK